MRWILATLVLLACSPAMAADWVHCADPGGSASFDYLPGDDTGVLSVASLTITAGEKVWASDVTSGPGDPVSVGQAFEDTDTVRIDALDGKAAKLAELRLFKTRNVDAPLVYGGTLQITGMGAWVVSCSPG